MLFVVFVLALRLLSLPDSSRKIAWGNTRISTGKWQPPNKVLYTRDTAV